MSSRELALIWGIVLGFGAAVTLALTVFHEDPASNDISGAQVIVIGSSLMLHATPPSGTGHNSLLGDGRPYARLAMSGITEDQTVTLLELALATPAKTIFIEANALAFDFASRAPASSLGGIQVAVVMRPLLDLSNRMRAQLITLFDLLHSSRRPPETLQDEPDLDTNVKIPQKILEKNYPLRLRGPRNPEALEAVLKPAMARGVMFILIAPPRSQMAANMMGAQATEALRLHFQALARHLNLPLFEPEAVWPNDHFVDSAHMNRRGRSRFMDELAHWWKSKK